MFNHYLAVLDAARNASRFSSDSQFDISDADTNCNTTRDFYRQAACLAVRELANEEPTIALCLPGMVTLNCDGTTWDQMDDVIISVFSVLRKPSSAVLRFPDMACTQYGWSYAADIAGASQCSGRTGLHETQFTSAEILGLLEPGAPNTGFVLVEVNFNYHHILGLPWFTQFVGNPIPFHLYALWPLVSAEPTSTPKP